MGSDSAGFSTTQLPRRAPGPASSGHQDRGSSRDDLADHAQRLVEVVGHGVVVDLAELEPSCAGMQPAKVAEVVDGQRDVGVQGSRIGLPLSHVSATGQQLEVLLPRRSAIFSSMLARSVGGGAAPLGRSVSGVERQFDVLGGGAGSLGLVDLAGDPG